MGKTSSLLEDLIEKAGGCAVVDGGFATQLEIHGATINDPLWSALCLIKDPDLIKRVHLEYLEAGADILATIPGFLSKDFPLKKGVYLKGVQIGFAASIGSYGAYLADGSEYSGCYGPDMNLDKLKDFHRRRLQVLVRSCPDLLAFETIPNKLEAQLTEKPIVVYPNSGEPSKCFGDDKFELYATKWRDLGAKLIGGVAGPHLPPFEPFQSITPIPMSQTSYGVQVDVRAPVGRPSNPNFSG
ncbi:Homocysteine S-methyltransferase 1 [Vitis vinifera]|uniref:Homocysteine S-methyltransferase 1 n=1 Tax=Vitis vinifera TaxID=29760 RepID=A0A438ECJ6_VITVI|nr:Homocysteine S-methyltransferase 1 [Vitis vinifera]